MRDYALSFALVTLAILGYTALVLFNAKPHVDRTRSAASMAAPVILPVSAPSMAPSVSLPTSPISPTSAK